MPTPDHDQKLRLITGDPDVLEAVMSKTIVVAENNRAAIAQVDSHLVIIEKKMDEGFKSLSNKMFIGFLLLTLLCAFSLVLNCLLVSHALDKSAKSLVVDTMADK